MCQRLPDFLGEHIKLKRLPVRPPSLVDEVRVTLDGQAPIFRQRLTFGVPVEFPINPSSKLLTAQPCCQNPALPKRRRQIHLSAGQVGFEFANESHRSPCPSVHIASTLWAHARTTLAGPKRSDENDPHR